MSPHFFNESVNIYRIPTAHQALGKVAAQNRHDPILKSSNLKPCAPDARDVRGRNKDFLTSTRKTGDGSELKGTSRGGPDITVRYRASCTFWELVGTRANLHHGVVVVGTTVQGHLYMVSINFSPDTRKGAPLPKPKPD